MLMEQGRAIELALQVCRCCLNGARKPNGFLMENLSLATISALQELAVLARRLSSARSSSSVSFDFI